MKTDDNHVADNHAAHIVILMVLALIAVSVLVFIQSTPYGVGLVSDSVNYINGARSIAEGGGYYRQSGGNTVKPITNFPPLYSIILSLPILFGMDGLSAAWWVSLVFFVLNTVLLVALVWNGSGSPWAGLCSGVLFLFLRPYLYYQFYAMSEPVYFFFTLLAFLFFFKAYDRDAFCLWLGCGVACGCAFLARYIGIVSLCAIFGAILIFEKAAPKKALAGLFSGSLPLIFSWLFRNLLVSGNASNRQVLAHWVTAEDLKHGVLILCRWIFPQRYGNLEVLPEWMVLGAVGSLAIGLVFVLVMIGVGVCRKSPVHLSVVSIWVYVLFILGYLAAVVLTISYFDASVNIEERILFPAFMALLLIPLTCTGAISRTKAYPLCSVFIVVLAFLGFCFAQDTIDHLSEMAEGGYGWGWEGWQRSPAMGLLRDLPEDTLIYSNQVEAVSMWAEKGAFALLDPIDPSNEQRRDGYDESMNEIRRQVKEGEAVLAFFGVSDWVTDDPNNWVTQLCEGLPFIYKDTSEWVVGNSEKFEVAANPQ